MRSYIVGCATHCIQASVNVKKNEIHVSYLHNLYRRSNLGEMKMEKKIIISNLFSTMISNRFKFFVKLLPLPS